MTNNNGPAISVERLLLASDGQYISQELPVCGWRSGLASTHPALLLRAGGCHDHVPGPGCSVR